MVVTNRAGVDEGELASIAELVEAHTTLERVVRWSMATGRDIRRIVKQDEFTQDVVVAYEGALYLVYDST